MADYFGTRRFATTRGLSNTMTTPLGIITPIIAGRLFDSTGSYTMIFIIYAVVMAMGGLCIMLVRRPQWSELAAKSPPPTASRP